MKTKLFVHAVGQLGQSMLKSETGTILGVSPAVCENHWLSSMEAKSVSLGRAIMTERR